MVPEGPLDEAILGPPEEELAQEASEGVKSTITPWAEESAEKAEEKIMGDYFRDSPIKNGEKTLEVQDPLVEVNLGSDE